jgi:hypothetical protein
MADNGSEPEPEQVLCLFLIVVDLDGSSRAVLDPSQRFVAQRPANPKDVFPAVANVAADFQGLKAAEAVMSFQTQIARQMADNQAAAEAAQSQQPPGGT